MAFHAEGITICNIKWCNHCESYVMGQIRHPYSTGSDSDIKWLHCYDEVITAEQVRQIESILRIA